MIESFSSQIKVAVRIRPLLPGDYKLSRQKGIKTEHCVKAKSDGQSISLIKDTYHTKDFRYDQVFGYMETQQDVYDRGCRQLVSEFTNGYNACLLCYGQSGTGKTYTMFGANTKDWSLENNVTGILQHSLVDIFAYIQKCRLENKTAKLYVSFYEIYLECVRDLLIPGKIRGQKVNLSIRECPERGTYIEGLSIFEVEDLESLYELLHMAVARRVTGNQKLNSTSSRSHAIVRLVLEHEVAAGEDDNDSVSLSDENPILTVRGKVRKNIFTFGDLAGSERLGKSKSTGAQLKEAQNINKSISALGNCVQALAFSSNKRDKGGITASHIPFRDSKLTRLLADALSGNTKTYFISSVGPAMHSYTETLSTLSFSSRAASVKKIVVKERASKEAFTDLSREMFDWQWPAVYRKVIDPAPPMNVIDDTDWTYDAMEDELGMSHSLPSTKLSVNEFLCKPEPACSSRDNMITSPFTEVDQKQRITDQDITIYESFDSGDKQQPLTPEHHGGNNLLFELASGVKDFGSVYRHNSPRDYHDEEKESQMEAVGVSEDFLDHNMYLSYPPPNDEKSVPMTVRRAPPIPKVQDDDDEDELIQYESERPVLKSAMKSADHSKLSVESSIIDELDNLSGEIKSLRENLAEIESSRLQSSLGSRKGDPEMKEICFDDLASSTDDLFLGQELSGGDDGNNDNEESGHIRYDDDDVLFTIDGEGGSPMQTLEKSIISCTNENDGDGFVPREHTLLQDFSIQDLDDELNKIKEENGFNIPHISTPLDKKKEIRFDLRSTPGYDASEIVDVSLTTSAIKRYRVPPPPPMPLPRHQCDSCDELKTHVATLECDLAEKNQEIYALKEFIYLNKLQYPAVSVKDGISGAFF